MSYLLIESFSQGLDTRRSILTSKPGTLQECVNAHITRGGEIEKRKEFTSAYALPAGQTFGLCAASNSLYVFGSDNGVVVPSGLTYQRLPNPANSSLAMTAVLYTEVFNGLPYVISQYEDGSVFHFYNGNNVTAWNSIAATVGDNTGIAAALAAQITLAANITTTSVAAVVTVTYDSNNVPFSISTAAISGTNSISAVQTQAAGAGQPEIWQITIGGTFNVNSVLSATVTVPSTSFNQEYRVNGGASGRAKVVKTFKNKMYAGTRSLLYFSQINSATAWNTNVNGSGFINMSNQDAGSEDLTALASYQGRLAIFSPSAIQVWAMDPDPLKNAQVQVLNSIGTRYPKSVVNFGDIDVFFLAGVGIRSMKARDASNSAAVSDIGIYIDTVVAADLAKLTEVVRSQACAIVEQVEGRYMLAVGPRIYVYSYFPSSNISAWSVYEPGFTVSDFAYTNGKLYARAEDTIYLYGGNSGNAYDDCEVTVRFPYLDGGKPAHRKTLEGIDAAVDGTWDVFVNCDTSALDAYDQVATIEKATYDTGRISAVGTGTHFGAKLVSKTAGYARISNFAFHYKGGEEDQSP